MSTGDLAGIDEAIRRQLIVLARRPGAHIAEFRPGRPIDWRPRQVRNPNGRLDTHFTNATAWKLIADRLERGQEVTIIELDQPKGAKGYVMSIDLGPDVPCLYVKLELGSGEIIGRSFHYSEYR